MKDAAAGADTLKVLELGRQIWRRLADEHDAAGTWGEVATGQMKTRADGKSFQATAANLGQIDRASLIHDVDFDDPGFGLPSVERYQYHF